jgi:hypothetical protein
MPNKENKKNTNLKKAKAETLTEDLKEVKTEAQ